MNLVNPYILGAAGGGPATTWNPSDKGASITLSNSDKTAARGGTGTWEAVRAVASHSSGQYYYELVFDSITAPTSGHGIVGVGKAAANISNHLGVDAHGWGWQCPFSSPRTANNSSFTSYGAAIGVGDVIGVALDLTAGTLVYYKNNSSQGTAFSSLSGTFFPMISLYVNIQATARFDSTEWSYSPPAGHTQW